VAVSKSVVAASVLTLKVNISSKCEKYEAECLLKLLLTRNSVLFDFNTDERK